MGKVIDAYKWADMLVFADKAMNAMKKNRSVVSPIRCKWEPAEKESNAGISPFRGGPFSKGQKEHSRCSRRNPGKPLP